MVIDTSVLAATLLDEPERQGRHKTPPVLQQNLAFVTGFPAGPAGAILVHDSGDDQPVAHEPYHIKERLLLLGHRSQAQGYPVEGIDAEGRGKKQKKRSRVSRQKRRKNRAATREAIARAPQIKEVMPAPHSAFQISPYNSTSITTSAIPRRRRDRSNAGNTTLSRTSSRLLAVNPAKQRPLHRSKRYRFRPYAWSKSPTQSSAVTAHKL